MIIPHKNWVVPPDTVKFITAIQENIVVCKGDGCVPYLATAPYELSIESADVSNGKVTVRFGYDSRHLHEWKLPAFTDKFAVTKYPVHAWIGLWADSDGYKYILYGFTNEIPLGVTKVVLIDLNGNVYYAEAPTDENAFSQIGTVNDIIIAIKDLRGKNVVSVPKIPIWIPILIALGIIGGTGAVIAYFNARSAEERAKAIEAQQETVQAILDYCKQDPEACRSAGSALMELVTSSISLNQVTGGSHEGENWINKLWNTFKQWIVPVGAIILTIITFLKLCLLYTSPSPRDLSTSRMPSSA